MASIAPTKSSHTHEQQNDNASPQVVDEALNTASLFKHADFESIRPLLANCTVRKLAEGDILIAEGRPNENLYIVLSGQLTVRLSSADAAPLTKIGRGEVVGELSAIDGKPTSAFAVAAVRSTILVIDEELMWMLVNTSHAVATNLLYMLSQRLRSGNEIIFERSKRLEQFQYHATVDALTGLYNRHWLSNMLPRQMHRSRTCEEPMCILMIDLDEFKSYNDTNGHVAGDAALGAVSTCLRNTLRPTDMAARYGGEEFIVLLPSCGSVDAEFVAERVRTAVVATNISHTNGEALPSVTISIGYAELTSDGTVEDFISSADQALYQAKQAGRNCVRG